MRRPFLIYAHSFIVTVAVTVSVGAAEWPQWRGPNRDGVWPERGIIQKFDKPQIPLRWETAISSGYSGPTVADGRVYVTDRITQPQQMERVHCFDAFTGGKIWSHSYECVYRNVQYMAGPRAAVSIDRGRAYSLGTMGHFFCFDAADGSVLWKKDLATEYQIRAPIWGIAAAPLIEEDLVILQIGGAGDACLVAFDKKTGQERWRALPDRPSYSSPIVIDQAGTRVLVCWTGDRVTGLDPLSGELYWDHPFTPSRMVLNVSTPVVENDRLFVTAFYDGSLMLKLDRNRLAVERVWRRKGPNERRTDALHSIISTPYLEGDYVYGVDSYGELRSLDARTGDRIWESIGEATPRDRWSNIHFVRHEEEVWMFNERGELIISRLSPKGFEAISRAQLIEPTTAQLQRRGTGVCWSHPAFAYQHVFARNDEKLVCASLAAE